MAAISQARLREGMFPSQAQNGNRRRAKSVVGTIAVAYSASRFVPAFTTLSTANTAVTRSLPSLGSRGGQLTQALPTPQNSIASFSVTGPLMGLGLAGIGLRSLRTKIARKGFEDVIYDLGWEVRGFSLAQVALTLGIFLLGFSFWDYFRINDPNSTGGSGVGGFFFIYAIPMLLVGLALFYAELQPVEIDTAADAEGLFEKKSTEILQKVKKDVTRHRYGDDGHLDTSLKSLGLVIPGNKYPQLFKILETKAPSGELEFTLLFKSKEVPYTRWSEPINIHNFDRFFGPGLWSEVYKYSGEEKVAAIKLTTGPRPADKPLPEIKMEDEDDDDEEDDDETEDDTKATKTAKVSA